MKFRTPSSLLAAAALVLGTGCSSLRTVTVHEDAALAGASVIVDVIPITAQNAGQENVSVSNYWHGAALRHSANVTTLRFGVGQLESQQVMKNWQQLGAKKVVVIADLPGVFQDLPGDADARRKSITVGKAATVTVRLSPTGLTVE